MNPDRFSKSIIHHFFKNDLSIKLKEQDFIEQNITHQIESAAFTRAELIEIRAKTEGKIPKIEKENRNILIWTSIPVLILFISIIGIEFELSTLGLKLSNIQNAKEIILLTLVTSEIFFKLKRSHLNHLKTLEHCVNTKIFGKEKALFLKENLSDHFKIFNQDNLLQGKNLKSSGIGSFLFWLEMIQLLIKLTALSILLLTVHLVILYDIYKNSNYEDFGPPIAIFVFMMYITTILHELITGFFKIKFIDHRKIAYFSLMSPDGTDLRDDVIEYIQNKVKKQKTINFIILLAISTSIIVTYSILTGLDVLKN